MLNAAEIKSLHIIASQDTHDTPPRVHMEKLSRLDLIEPCAQGVCLSPRGQQVLKTR
jgi:hypothetical protein